MIAEFRDYLKTLKVAQYYYIGKIENSKEEAIGIYADASTRRVEAVGKDSSYGMFGVRILIHWNKNAKETETQARTIFESIRYIKDLDLTTEYIYYIDWDYDEPIFVGTDANGVYEYVITGVIYHKKG